MTKTEYIWTINFDHISNYEVTFMWGTYLIQIINLCTIQELHTSYDKKIKNSKRQVGIEFNSATKSKETRNKILGRENILA